GLPLMGVAGLRVAGLAVTRLAVAGLAVAGLAVTGLAVTGLAVTGLAMTGCRVTGLGVADGLGERRQLGSGIGIRHAQPVSLSGFGCWPGLHWLAGVPGLLNVACLWLAGRIRRGGRPGFPDARLLAVAALLVHLHHPLPSAMPAYVRQAGRTSF